MVASCEIQAKYNAGILTGISQICGFKRDSTWIRVCGVRSAQRDLFFGITCIGMYPVVPRECASSIWYVFAFGSCVFASGSYHADLFAFGSYRATSAPPHCNASSTPAHLSKSTHTPLTHTTGSIQAAMPTSIHLPCRRLHERRHSLEHELGSWVLALAWASAWALAWVVETAGSKPISGLVPVEAD